VWPWSVVLPPVVKPKVFVSFHHGNDQFYFDLFTGTFGDGYEVFYDRSLDGHVRSDDTEYVNRVIREEYIVGSSVTIVLCGRETWKRKYVDWEIYSTLYHEHALLGIELPTIEKTYEGKVIVPARLHANIASGYAHWTAWPNSADALRLAIDTARLSSRSSIQIDNRMPKMQRNLP